MNVRENVGLFPSGDSWDHIGGTTARVVLYKNGARVYFDAGTDGGGNGREKGAVVLDQSGASRRRVAFAFGNAECDWLAMSLRTWHHAPTAKEMKLAEDRLRRAWRERWGEPVDAWIMEMQGRGVPHFHGFHATESIFGRALAESPTEVVWRNGKLRTVFRGECDRWLVGAWLAASKQLGDVDCLAVHRMGIIEKMMSPDAAGRYVAKESAKREQKILPEAYQSGLGRWWWMNPAHTPRPRYHGLVDLAQWPFEHPASRVWETRDIADTLFNVQKVDTGLAPKVWLRWMGFEADPDESLL